VTKGWGVQELVADWSVGCFIQPQNSQVVSFKAATVICSFAPQVNAIPRAGHQKVVAELEKGEGGLGSRDKDQSSDPSLAVQHLFQSLVKADL
jgi:hypothetical protein